MNGACSSTFCYGPAPWDPGEGSNITKFQLQSQIQRFSYQNFCVFTQIKDLKHIEWDFHSVAWVMPQGWDLGVRGVKNLIFQTWSCGISN